MAFKFYMYNMPGFPFYEYIKINHIKINRVKSIWLHCTECILFIQLIKYLPVKTFLLFKMTHLSFNPCMYPEKPLTVRDLNI